jgi:hypothetical protein
MSTTTRVPVPRWLARAGLAWSLACIACAIWWLLDPESAPLPASDDPVSLLGYLQPRPGAALCLAFAVLGAVVAARSGRPGREDVSRGAVVAGAAAAVFFGIVAPDIQLLTVLGYLMALLGVPVIVTLLVTGARRHRANLFVLALIGAAIAAGIAAGEIGAPTV